MKVLHIPFGYFPDVRGGTEVYVAALCRELSLLGHRNGVAAPGERVQSYKYQNVDVFRYPVDTGIGEEVRNGCGDPKAAAYVSKVLDEWKPDIVHFHALTSGVSLDVLRAVKKNGVIAILTYHTPTVTCARGTLLLMGETVCDGLMDEERCTVCSLQGLGVPGLLARIVATLPKWVGRSLAAAGGRSRLVTALRRREMVGIRHVAVRKVFEKVDYVIGLCNWTVQLMRINQLALGKNTIIRHALPHVVGDIVSEQRAVPTIFTRQNPVKLVYLGRIAQEKGVDIIVNAVSKMPPTIPVDLDIYGLSDGFSGISKMVIDLAERDLRINVLDPVPPAEVTDLLRKYHVLLVPSQWLETGPFVVLESLFAATPVIGSRLGGIEEQVRHGLDGLLVDDYANTNAWSKQIKCLLDEPALIDFMRNNINPPAGFENVAKAHLVVYQRLLEEVSQ